MSPDSPVTLPAPQLKFSVTELERMSLAQDSSTEDSRTGLRPTNKPESSETFTDFDSMEEMYLFKV